MERRYASETCVKLIFSTLGRAETEQSSRIEKNIGGIHLVEHIINFVFVILLVAFIYFPIVILISFICALKARSKGKDEAKKKFKDIFFTFLLEFSNPFNWF